MKRLALWAFVILAALVLAVLLLTRNGDGCRPPPPDDDEPVPACEPGDKRCYGAAPGRPAA